MIEFITDSANNPFSIAILVMFGIAVLEGVCILLGFGIFQFFDTLLPNLEIEAEIDLSSDIESPSALSRFFSWLRVGKVPLLMLFIVFLTSFGIIGFTIQFLCNAMVGSFLPAWLASVPAVLLSLPVISGAGKLLEKIMPNDETEAVSSDSLVGRVATITLGTAKKGFPAEARVSDKFGATHYVMVEPEKKDVELASGSEVLLIKNMKTYFIAILNPNTSLTD